MKRICLFAGYDIDGLIDDYVVNYIKELSHFADVYYFADCDMKPKELVKLTMYTKKSWAQRLGKYDFGSWAEIINKIGWDEIGKYDELILANDSQYLVGNLDSFFGKMESQHFDFWAGVAVCEDYNNGKIPFDKFLSEYHILETNFTFVSSFLVFTKKVFTEDFVKHFFSQINKEEKRVDVSIKYEYGLTRMLLRHKVNYGLFIEDIYTQVSIYKNVAFDLVKSGYPFIKIKVFINQFYPIIAPVDRLPILKYYNPDLDIEVIAKHITRLKIESNRTKKTHNQSINIRFSMLLRLLFKFIYRVSPFFISPFYQKIYQRFQHYWNEAGIYGEKYRIYYFLRLITTIPEQIKLGRNLQKKDKLIIYFNVSRNQIGGGMLSINRFVEKTKEIKFLKDYEIIESGIPLNNPPVKNKYFRESLPQIKFSTIIKYSNPVEVIIHIPEVFVELFCLDLNQKEKEWLVKIPKLQINIMDQNNTMMPHRAVIRNTLAEITENITITTAHRAYNSQFLSNKYTAPVHTLTPFLPKFEKVNFSNKKKCIITSNDNNIENSDGITKRDIINKLGAELKDFEIIEINKLPLDDYKKLIANSMFTITFGEGYDGYFIEPILSNSISFAVYNNIFFPPEFYNCSNVYKSWKDLFNNITNDIKRLSEDENEYQNIQETASKLISDHISDQISLKELENFYLQKYDYLPNKFSYQLFINIKKELIDSHYFNFFGGVFNDDYVIAPDGNLFINMRGEFYGLLYEIYVKNDYYFEIEEDFILIDLGYHAGITSLYLLKKFNNLKKIFGYEPMLYSYYIANKNLNNNHIDKNKVVLKQLGLSDCYITKSFPYIPDWSTGMSTDNNFYYNTMFSTTDMPDDISYIEAEIVPAYTEIQSILDSNDMKVVLKCDVQGAEFKIFNNLVEHGLLNRIDIIIIETHNDDPSPIIKSLIECDFSVDDKLDYEPNNIHMIYAKRNK